MNSEVEKHLSTHDKSRAHVNYANEGAWVIRVNAELQTSDGYILNNASVDQLVSAMASFTPPASGQLTLTPELDTALQPVISATWQ